MALQPWRDGPGVVNTRPSPSNRQIVFRGESEEKEKSKKRNTTDTTTSSNVFLRVFEQRVAPRPPGRRRLLAAEKRHVPLRQQTGGGEKGRGRRVAQG